MLELGESWSKAKLGSVVAGSWFSHCYREAGVAKEHGLRLDWRIYFTEPRGGTSSSVADAEQNIVGTRGGGN